jgi:hypothetical protein
MYCNDSGPLCTLQEYQHKKSSGVYERLRPKSTQELVVQVQGHPASAGQRAVLWRQHQQQPGCRYQRSSQ